jgi:hypothetical protein
MRNSETLLAQNAVVTQRAVIIAMVLFLSAPLFGGCARGPALGQVDGNVRLNGEPIPAVMVIFIPEDRGQPQSMGVTDAQGRFQLRCNNGALGAVVGEHRVTVIDAAGAPAAKSKADDELPEGANAPASRVPRNYMRSDKTRLRQSVQPGSQTITIDLQTN